MTDLKRAPEEERFRISGRGESDTYEKEEGRPLRRVFASPLFFRISAKKNVGSQAF